MVFEKIYENSIMTQQHPIYEIASKEMAYVFDNPQFSQPVNEFLKTTGYKIDQFFNDPGTGFQAFGLIPISSNTTPVLVIRGTSEPIDDLANHDPRGIGMNQFAANRAEIAAWLTKTAQATGRKPDVIGHSLGGAIAQIVVTELMNFIGEVVTFSSPATSWAIAERFLQKGGSGKTVTHYVVDGDIVSLAGEAFIAGTVFFQSFTDPAINPLNNLRKHQQIGRLLSAPPPGFTQTEISVQALNHPAFTYNNADYLEFLTAYYAVNPGIARQLTSRGRVEALRRSDSSFQQIFADIQNRLAPSSDNLLVGDRQNNTADGAAGNDILVGKGGNDALNGGGGKDVLVGVDSQSKYPGFQEIDILSGGDDPDIFVLGKQKLVFYRDGNLKTPGYQDYALITDFSEGDVIQLAGTAADYTLKAVPQGLPAGTAIYLKQENELVGIVQGKSKLNLNSNSFCYVDSIAS
ncbi:MAG: calcium-binding protein [Leptolyngbyaceae cyanobacterium RU_5_1]|nr:calcium-binding protein [Leptolyngbyaceae cyanobacterium RU_5_1]